MADSKHIRHYHRRLGFSYPVSVTQKLYSLVVLPLLFILVAIVILKIFSVYPLHSGGELSLTYLGKGLLFTFLRLLAAYILAVVIALPLSLVISYSPKTERFLFPLFDITQSIPVLAFFPVVIVLFAKFNFLNGAAIFILFLSMLWNIVFSVIGGLKVVPTDIKAVAQVFGIKKIAYLKQVIIPAVFPYIVTGSLLAWAQGWNVIIVAEVIHTYIPSVIGASDLFGIGSILVNSIASGRNEVFISAILVMVSAIAFINFFIWQKLLRYVEKFKFE